MRRRTFLLGAAASGALAAAACSGSNANKRTAATVSGAAGSPAPAGGASGTAATGGVAATAAAPRAASPAAAAASVTPRKGGTLSVGATADLELNDGFPFRFLGTADNLFMWAALETLIRYDQDLTPKLVLADRFEYNADHTKLMVHLKPGVTFHNGAPLTPDDVFFGIDLLTNPAKYNLPGALQLTSFAKAIVDKQKLDDLTMQFSFDQARPNMSDFFAQLYVTQAAGYDKFRSGQDLQGTGPYKFVSWSPNQSFKLAPNPNWHDKARTGGPFLDGIESKVFADEDARALAIQAGEIDVAYLVTPSTATQFRGKGLTRVAPRTGLSYLGVVTTNPEISDPRVRQALFLAIDRQRWVDDHGEGFLKVTTQSWPSTSPAFDPKLERAWYDQATAKDLLKQAAFKQSAPFTIEYTPNLQDAAAPAFLQAQLDAVGVKTQLVPLEMADWVSRFVKFQYKALFLHSHGFANLSPLTLLQQAGPFLEPNPEGMDDPIYLDVIKQLSSLDPNSAGAKMQYARFNQLWLDKPWMLGYQEGIRIDVVGSKVKGHDVYGVTVGDAPDFGAVWKTG